jgi:hypothetical protein
MFVQRSHCIIPVCSFHEVPLNLLHIPNLQRLLVKASSILFLFVFYLTAQDGFNTALISRYIWASSADVRFSTQTGGKAGLPKYPNHTYNYTNHCIRITRVLRVGSRLYLVCTSSCIHVVG